MSSIATAQTIRSVCRHFQEADVQFIQLPVTMGMSVYEGNKDVTVEVIARQEYHHLLVSDIEIAARDGEIVVPVYTSATIFDYAKRVQSKKQFSRNYSLLATYPSAKDFVDAILEYRSKTGKPAKKRKAEEQIVAEVQKAAVRERFTGSLEDLSDGEWQELMDDDSDAEREGRPQRAAIMDHNDDLDLLDDEFDDVPDDMKDFYANVAKDRAEKRKKSFRRRKHGSTQQIAAAAAAAVAWNNKQHERYYAPSYPQKWGPKFSSGPYSMIQSIPMEPVNQKVYDAVRLPPYDYAISLWNEIYRDRYEGKFGWFYNKKLKTSSRIIYPRWDQLTHPHYPLKDRTQFVRQMLKMLTGRDYV